MCNNESVKNSVPCECIQKMNDALRMLCDKYSVAATGEIVKDKAFWSLKTANAEIHLLPWRTERRFFELKKFLNDGTLENLSTLRFASIQNGGCLKCQIAKEMDLAVFMTGSPVASVFTACAAEPNTAANIIAKLQNDVSLCIECSCKLPAGKAEMDRHELIAARGVASDQTVDTQTPHSSVYVFSENGTSEYTDTDTELFGFPNEAVLVIRAAFAVLSKPELAAEWNSAFDTMMKNADAALKSDAEKKTVLL